MNNDLAAHAAREQARDAVIDLARVATAIIVPTEAAAAVLRPLKQALAALDALGTP